MFGGEGVEGRQMFFLANIPTSGMNEMMSCPLLVLCRGQQGLENRGELSVITGLERNLFIKQNHVYLEKAAVCLPESILPSQASEP